MEPLFVELCLKFIYLFLLSLFSSPLSPVLPSVVFPQVMVPAAFSLGGITLFSFKKQNPCNFWWGRGFRVKVTPHLLTQSRASAQQLQLNTASPWLRYSDQRPNMPLKQDQSSLVSSYIKDKRRLYSFLSPKKIGLGQPLVSYTTVQKKHFEAKSETNAV